MAKHDPVTLAFDCWRLGLESCAVISLRLPRIMTGDAAAAAEARRMVSEKVEAAATLQIKLMTGALGTNAQDVTAASVAHYRKGVRKNKQRLSR